MQCRSCGAEIADKALICYKCGTATTEAKYQPAEPQKSSSRAGLVATVIALALILVLFIVMGRVATGEPSQWLRYAAVVVAVIIVALTDFAGGRRRGAGRLSRRRRRLRTAAIARARRLRRVP